MLLSDLIEIKTLSGEKCTLISCEWSDVVGSFMLLAVNNQGKFIKGRSDDFTMLPMKVKVTD